MKFLTQRMIEQDPESKWYMPGTERTGEYITVGISDLGRVGFRLTGNYVRVRVEPRPVNESVVPVEELAPSFTRDDGWKQPQVLGEYRFSKMFYNADEAIAAIEGAIKALGKAGLERRGGYTRFWRKAIRQYLPLVNAQSDESETDDVEDKPPLEAAEPDELTV
jgi:hypothetical protein